ncbi:MAG: NACHT domain-containing protein [Alkalinema sp. RU_4_3]|nr:NACHT domain-containing protein [Alkalinema sp. RU_4_3]
MAKRSLKASAHGIAKAKQIFERREWTQEYLASAVGLQTRQSIWKFFTGRPIERYLFIDICFQLDIDWEEIVDRPQFDASEPELLTTQLAVPTQVVNDPAAASAAAANFAGTWLTQRDAIVAPLQVRYQSVSDLLDIYQPVNFSQLFTDIKVNVYQQSRQWLENQELQEQLNYPQQADFREIPYQFNQADYHGNQDTRGFGHSNFDGCSSSRATINGGPEYNVNLSHALEQHRRITLLAKVGAGKSFLLRSLAVEFSAPEHHAGRLPVFMTLPQLEVALANLENGDCLATWLFASWPDRPQALTQPLWCWLLESGKVVLLLDSLDTVSHAQRPSLNQIIQGLAKVYPHIDIVIASRFGVADAFYPGFLPMTIAELTQTQIQQISQKWFSTFAAATSSEVILRAFLEQIFDKRHRRLHDLAQTPLFLHLLCLTFCDRQQLPQGRSRLYEYILDSFLQHRAATSNFICNSDLPVLSPANLVEIFSQIAFSEFAAGRMIFEKSTILSTLASYIAQQSSPPSNAEQLWRASSLMLDQLIVRYGLLVEEAKGLYTFSQPVFQEYLSARYIVIHAVMPSNSRSHSQKELLYLDHLAEHIIEPRWHEVILLVLEMLPHRICFLQMLQKQLSSLMLQTDRLNQCFHWIEHHVQTISQELEDSPAIYALRAFYFGTVTNLGLDLAYGLDPRLAWQLPTMLAQDLNCIRLLGDIETFANNPTTEQGIQIILAIQAIEPKIDSSGQHLSAILAILWQKIQQQELGLWSQADLLRWVNSCRSAIRQIIEMPDLGQWTSGELTQLEQYYWANIFLLECLKKTDQASAQIKPSFYLNFLKSPKADQVYLIEQAACIA